jgi:mannose-6-phosphate isomerase-like protein (cupin superfamily)
MAHCVLRPDQTSAAQVHKKVGEIWCCLQGLGQVWRKPPDGEPATVDVGPGRHLTIEVGTHFQFRNTGAVPLTFIIATIPSWPGPDEAEPVEGPWRPVARRRMDGESRVLPWERWYGRQKVEA